MVKELDCSGRTLDWWCLEPGFVGVCVGYVVGPFVVRPVVDIVLTAFSMTSDPFGLEQGLIRPERRRNDDISVNWVGDGMVIVVVTDGVDA